MVQTFSVRQMENCLGEAMDEIQGLLLSLKHSPLHFPVKRL